MSRYVPIPTGDALNRGIVYREWKVLRLLRNGTAVLLVEEQRVPG